MYKASKTYHVDTHLTLYGSSGHCNCNYDTYQNAYILR
jgi:hypothetical protein